MTVINRNIINALSHEAVRHIKAEAYAEAGENVGLFYEKCVEIAFDYPHYAKPSEICRSFNLNYHFTRHVINSHINKSRQQRDEQYEREQS